MRRSTDPGGVVRADLSRIGWALVRMRALAAVCLATTVLSSCSLATAPAMREGDLRALLVVQWSAGDAYAGHGFLLSRPGAPNLALTAHSVAGPQHEGRWPESPLNSSFAILVVPR